MTASDATRICIPHMRPAYASRLSTDGRTDGQTQKSVTPRRNLAFRNAREKSGRGRRWEAS